MPIYEYQCDNCHRMTEALLKVGEKGPRKCEHCGGKLTRVISRTSFQLKGGGWYKDLYASTKPGSTDSGESSGGSGETKAAAKSETKSEAKPEAKTEKPAGKGTKADSPKSSSGKAGKAAAKKTG